MSRTRPKRTKTSPGVMTIRTPIDTLAAIPVVLGFVPSSSVVVLSFSPTGRDLHARIDFPRSQTEREQTIEALGRGLRQARARTCVVVLYVEEAAAAQEFGPVLEQAFRDLGVEVEVMFGVAGSHYFWIAPQADPELVAFDLRDHPFTAQAVLQGQRLFANREELARSVQIHDDVATAQIEGLISFYLADFGERFSEATGRDQEAEPPEDLSDCDVVELHFLLREMAEIVRDHVKQARLEDRFLTDSELALLLVAIDHIQVRDVVWCQLTHDTAPALLRQWRDALQRTPEAWCAPLASLTGFAAWLCGDGALAWCAVDRARQSRPDYSMAHLLAQALERAVPPSTYEPITEDLIPLLQDEDPADLWL